MSVATFRDAVERFAPDYGLTLDSSVVDRFEAHYELLVRWNRRLNLTRITAPEEAARRHFLESAFLTTLVDEPVSVVDVGSGAGFPGLPLACVWSAAEVTLVEPLANRCVFLKEVVRLVGVTNVRVVQAKFS
ncbi:MAG TPA: 16S rRNA (guanine(527)-N(7))-methyltransferase RsmG, partial [Blastocatellia bacterium]|nr:16S rRNA (guanine(527)-N(7))-methyltransferase RsmG [Blastocatellia bacterium]